MDYSYPMQRRSKKDLKKKRLFRLYKRGGKFRTVNLTKPQKDSDKEQT